MKENYSDIGYSATNNDFVQLLQKLFVKTDQNVRKRKGYTRGENYYNLLTHDEKFIYDIEELYLSLTDTMRNMDLALEQMKHCYNREFFDSIGFTWYEFIAYHRDTFFTKVSTLKDICNKLVVAVYGLDAEDHQYSWNFILRHKQKIDNSILFDNYEKFYPTFKYFVDRRDQLNHGQSITIEELKDLLGAEFLRAHCKEFCKEEKIDAEAISNSQLFKSIRPYFEKLTINRTNLFKFINVHLQSLYPKFKDRILS